MSQVETRMLEIIERKRITTALELSRGLGISKPAVQYHIKQLIREGLIETIMPPQELPQKGRPVKYYRLSTFRRPDHYCGLAEALLLSSTAHLGDPEQVSNWAKIAAQNLVANLHPPAGHSFIKRMSAVMEHLEKLNYQPHWEVHANGVRIHFRNCPYARLASGYPVLCEMDKSMLDYLLDLPVLQETVWRNTPNLSNSCTFFFTR